MNGIPERRRAHQPRPMAVPNREPARRERQAALAEVGLAGQQRSPSMTDEDVLDLRAGARRAWRWLRSRPWALYWQRAQWGGIALAAVYFGAQLVRAFLAGWPR